MTVKRCAGCYQVKPIEKFPEESDRCFECQELMGKKNFQFKEVKK